MKRNNAYRRQFILYKSEFQSDISGVTSDVPLNGTEMSILAILRQKPDSSRDEIADRISKTVRIVQRALDSLREKGYKTRRIGPFIQQIDFSSKIDYNWMKRKNTGRKEFL